MNHTATAEKNIPFWEKYCLTIEETAQYTGIGENRIRDLISDNKFASFILRKGSHVLIKRRLFEKFLDERMDI